MFSLKGKYKLTILVGILCEDGVVVASDGMVSTNLGTIPFVGFSNIKTHLIGDGAIVACAGDDRLMTYFIEFLKLNYVTLYNKYHKSPFDVLTFTRELGAQFANNIINNYKQYPTELVKDQLENIAKNGFQFQAIIALSFNGAHYIFEYDNRFNPTMLRDNGVWHIILGSGMYVANPSIHLVKKILNINSKPKVNRAQILAYWTVDHAIEVSSGGIGGETTIAVLQKANGEYKASVENKTSEHSVFMKDIYDYIWAYETFACSKEEIQEIPKL